MNFRLIVLLGLAFAFVPGIALSEEGEAKVRPVTITVVDAETGEPLKGVKVQTRHDAGREKYTTDDAGHVVGEVSYSPEGYSSIEAVLEGYVPMKGSWRPAEDGMHCPESVKIELPKGTSISGIIQNEDGEPIEKATVELLVPDEPYEGRIKPGIWKRRVRTDEDGKWLADFIPADLYDVWIKLSHRDYSNDNHFGATPKPSIEQLRDGTGVMVMKQGILMAGRVVDADGNPIAKAEVKQGADRWGSNYPSTRTRDDGSFAFRNTEAGTVVMTVQKEGFAPAVQKIVAAQEMKPIEFVLQSPHTVRGQVVDALGEPLEGVSVVADTWRGYRAISWRAKTDAEGMFEWVSAPEDPVQYDILIKGLMSARQVALEPNDEVHKITLHPELFISGNVVDAETKEPIPAFTVIDGIDWKNGSAPGWSRRDAREGKDGKYVVRHSYPYPAHLVRIEADGYLPGVSRPFLNGEGEQTYNFELRKGEGFAGIVYGPDGEPVEQATVTLCTASAGAYIENGSIRRVTSARNVMTDANGKFSFSALDEAFALVALHESGFAEIDQETWYSEKEIRLESWATLTGEVLVGGKPNPNVRVNVFYNRPYKPDAPKVVTDYSVETDERGQFTLERLIPGDMRAGKRLQLAEMSYTTTHAVPVTIEPGGTRHVVIGGTGRPVVGKITIPEGQVKPIDLSIGHRSINTKLPVVNHPDDLSEPEEIREWYTAMQETEEWKSRSAARRNYAYEIDETGSFRVDDIPPGMYTFSLHVNEPPVGNQCGFGAPIGTASFEFEVPPMEQSHSTEALDIGDHALTIRTNLKIGDTAPEFDVTNLAGGNIQLEDYRGKVVLLDFWATWCGPCISEVPTLKSVYEKFKDHPDFVMIALSLDQEADTPRDYASENSLDWVQGFIGDWSKTKLPEQYGVYGIPATMVIDREGNLAAKDLRGDAIIEAIEATLEQ